MIRNEDGAIELDEREALLVALFVAANVLADDEVVGWEDLPELTEDGFEVVLGLVNGVGTALREELEADGELAAALRLYEEVS